MSEKIELAYIYNGDRGLVTYSGILCKDKEALENNVLEIYHSLNTQFFLSEEEKQKEIERVRGLPVREIRGKQVDTFTDVPLKDIHKYFKKESANK